MQPSGRPLNHSLVGSINVSASNLYLKHRQHYSNWAGHFRVGYVRRGLFFHHTPLIWKLFTSISGSCFLGSRSTRDIRMHLDRPVFTKVWGWSMTASVSIRTPGWRFVFLSPQAFFWFQDFASLHHRRFWVDGMFLPKYDFMCRVYPRLSVMEAFFYAEESFVDLFKVALFNKVVDTIK